MEKFYDIEIKCECGEYFIWTWGEQKFMTQLCEEGKINEVIKPKRCQVCRDKKKKRFNESQMGN